MSAAIKIISPPTAEIGGHEHGYQGIAYSSKLATKPREVKAFDKEAIRAALPIEQVLSRYGFEPNARGFYHCPFHAERTPSARVFKQSLHCFGCGQRADVFGLVQHFEQADFARALELCAIMAGVGHASDFDLKEALARRKRIQAVEAQRRAASEAKYRLLADIARLARPHAPAWMPTLDRLLDTWLHGVPDHADMRPLRLSATGGSAEWVAHHLRRFVFEYVEVGHEQC